MSEVPELPPLPDALILGWDGYTADQMREYARQAVLQERERCAKLCEHNADLQCNPLQALTAKFDGNQNRAAAANWMRNVAAAIRNQG
jgi:hypothetical protein